MAGPRNPTDVNPNAFVESNAFAREVVERGFRFSPRNLGLFAVFGVAVPVLIYKTCVNEFVRRSLRTSAPFFSRQPNAPSVSPWRSPRFVWRGSFHHLPIV